MLYMKKAKIICTIGPSTSSKKTLASLIKAGMDAEYIRSIRELSRELDKPVMILQDLQGIKIRIGKVAGDAILTFPLKYRPLQIKLLPY
jgi:pyruvate kinase